MTFVKRENTLDFGKPETPLQRMKRNAHVEITHDHKARTTTATGIFAGNELERVTIPGILSRRAACAVVGVPFRK